MPGTASSGQRKLPANPTEAGSKSIFAFFAPAAPKTAPAALKAAPAAPKTAARGRPPKAKQAGGRKAASANKTKLSPPTQSERNAAAKKRKT